MSKPKIVEVKKITQSTWIILDEDGRQYKIDRFKDTLKITSNKPKEIIFFMKLYHHAYKDLGLAISLGIIKEYTQYIFEWSYYNRSKIK